mmetsp:Transcript_48504/g.138645  ORF Transcript_48504/g.138645 Transcript_48504/m.138645 type:complete len:266 (+) Transcript_48504:574-1371(+)
MPSDKELLSTCSKASWIVSAGSSGCPGGSMGLTSSGRPKSQSQQAQAPPTPGRTMTRNDDCPAACLAMPVRSAVASCQGSVPASLPSWKTSTLAVVPVRCSQPNLRRRSSASERRPLAQRTQSKPSAASSAGSWMARPKCTGSWAACCRHSCSNASSISATGMPEANRRERVRLFSTACVKEDRAILMSFREQCELLGRASNTVMSGAFGRRPRLCLPGCAYLCASRSATQRPTGPAPTTATRRRMKAVAPVPSRSLKSTRPSRT